MRIDSIGLIVAAHRPQAVGLAAEAADWLGERGIKVWLPSATAAKLGRENLGAEEGELAAKCAFLVSLGGDGTFLAAARLAAPAGKPLLGVHLGGFGFLAEVPQAKFYPALLAVLEGRFHIQERMMLAAEVVPYSRSRQSERWKEIALNEVVVANSALSRVIPMHTRVGGHYLSGFSADGLIISTPTGSTAYSLSAGGPVVDPQIRVIILTPICAHTLSARPLVVPADQEVKVSIGAMRPGQEVRLTVDGQTGILLEANASLRVRQAPFSAKLVCFSEPGFGAKGFYEKLRSKLGWGGRHR